MTKLFFLVVIWGGLQAPPLFANPEILSCSRARLFAQDVVKLILNRATPKRFVFMPPSEVRLPRGWQFEVDTAIKVLMTQEESPYVNLEQEVIEEVREVLSNPDKTLRFIDQSGLESELQSHTAWRTMLMRSQQPHLQFILEKETRDALWKRWEDLSHHPSSAQNLKNYYELRVSEALDAIEKNPARSHPQIVNMELDKAVSVTRGIMKALSQNLTLPPEQLSAIEGTLDTMSARLLQKSLRLRRLSSAQLLSSNPELSSYLDQLNTLSDVFNRYRFSRLSSRVIGDVGGQMDLLFAHIRFGNLSLKRYALQDVLDRYAACRMRISYEELTFILETPNFEFRKYAIEELKRYCDLSESHAMQVDHAFWRSLQYEPKDPQFLEEVQVMANLLIPSKALGLTSASLFSRLGNILYKYCISDPQRAIGAARTLGRFQTDQAFDELRGALFNIATTQVRVVNAVIEELATFTLKKEQVGEILRGIFLTAEKTEVRISALRALHKFPVMDDVAAQAESLLKSENVELRTLSSTYLLKKKPELLNVIKTEMMGGNLSPETCALVREQLSNSELLELAGAVQNSGQQADLLLEFYTRKENNSVATNLLDLFDQVSFFHQRRIISTLMGQSHDVSILRETFKKVMAQGLNGVSDAFPSVIESLSEDNAFERGMAMIKDDEVLSEWIQSQPSQYATQIQLYLNNF